MINGDLIIYFNENNISRAKWDLIVFACEILKGSLIIKELPSLKQRINNRPFFDNSNSLDRILLFNLAQESLIDTIRLCIFYENIAKAQLIEQHILVHNIDNKWSKDLFNEQKQRPIKLSEIDNIEPFNLDKANNKLTHKGILPQTIGLNTILKNKQYCDLIKIPEKITQFISEIKDRRNELHLNLEVTFKISKPIIQILEEIDNYALSLIDELKKLQHTT